MELDEIPTPEEIVQILEKVKKGLPKLIEKARKGTFEKVEEEGMAVLNNMPEDIISVSVKKATAIFRVILVGEKY